MSAARVHLIATEVEKNLPILIIDKKGFIGLELAEFLKEQFLVVLVSSKEPIGHKNIIHIPFKKKLPIIPDNSYSHSFIFYNGEEESLAILPKVINKSNESSGKVLLLVSISFSSPALDKRLKHHLYSGMPTVVYGEVFDGNLLVPNLVNYFIYQVQKFGKIEIPNEGLGMLYPVYLDDLLAVIVAIAFSQEKKKGYHFAFPQVPFTEMSVARIFQRINPEIKIDFSEKKVKIPKYYIPHEGVYVFVKYNLESSLRRLLKDANSLLERLSKREIAIKPGKKEISIGKIFLIAMTACFLPAILILTSFLAGSAFLGLSINSFSKAEFSGAFNYSNMARSSFAFSNNLNESYFLADYIAPVSTSKIGKRLKSGVDASEIGSNVFYSLSSFEKIYKDEKNRLRAQNAFLESLPDVKNSLLLLEEMRATNALPDSVVRKINSNDYLLRLVENTIDTYPDILGFENKRKYLLLFQNNMELRPGGGFIGSYGLADVDKGHFGRIEIHDVYEADGKLKTHIEPPFPLRRYGGVSHWFLRDSNFAIDGSANAAAAADLLRRSTGEKVQGVVVLDTNFIVNLLDVIGPVEVLDYSETVNSENFYMLTQKHAEVDFFPGSTQKKDFIRSLFGSILEAFAEGGSRNYLKLLGVIEQSIKEKHLAFIPLDLKTQKIFAVNNLTADLIDKRKVDKNTLNDFFGLVEANIGATKGNYYLNRSVVQKATISDSGQLFGEVNLSLENTSTKSSLFGGEYKAYVRFILPQGSDLRAVLIDERHVDIVDAITNPGVFAAVGFEAPSALEIDRFTIGDKSGYGFYISVAEGATKNVSINYAVAQAINMQDSAFTYSLRVFKQAGTFDDSYSLTLNYPAKFTPVNFTEGLVDLGGKVKLEEVLNTDKNIEVKFSQK